MIDTGRGHSDGRHAAHKDAADARAQQNTLGLHGAGSQYGELVPPVSFDDPGRLIAELFGQLDAVYDIHGRHPAAQRYAEAYHLLLLLVAVSVRSAFFIPTRRQSTPRQVQGRSKAGRGQVEISLRDCLRSEELPGASAPKPRRGSGD